jgi:ankyrin repeat protein
MNLAAGIHDLCLLGEIETVADLLENDLCRIQSKDPEGNSPLHIAVQYDHEKLVRLLIDFGAEINERNNNNSTPLHFGTCAPTANLLIDYGADIDAVDNNGNTPLHYACRSGDNKKAECLVENGADVNAADNKHFTPLDCATERCNMSLAHLLIKHGARESWGNHKKKDGVVPIINREKIPQLIKKVKPLLLGVLSRARICGIVLLCVVVNEDGNVESAVILSGHPLLRRPAVDAAKQYIYSPTIINGKARKVQFIISIKIGS